MGEAKKKDKKKAPQAKQKSSETSSSRRFRGIVSQVFGAYYDVRNEQKLTEIHQAVLRGKLRLEKKQEQNKRLRHLLMPGDLVEVVATEGVGENREGADQRLQEPSSKKSGTEPYIEATLPRENALFRSSPHEDHGLGANLDLAVCVVSLTDPEPRFGFLDRFLASCDHGEVEPYILFTKLDRFIEREDDEDKFEILELMEWYAHLGYHVGAANLLSEKEQPDLEVLNSTLSSGGITLLAGNSGTGKSTLLNAILGFSAQKTSGISDYSGKGRHTTTNSTMFLHPEGKSLIIDTPGVKEWGINHMNREDIFHSFLELRPYLDQCRFRNCDHSENVEGCAVQDVLDRSIHFERTDEGERIIHPRRIQNLYGMLESLDQPDRIRTGDYIKPTGRMRGKE